MARLERSIYGRKADPSARADDQNCTHRIKTPGKISPLAAGYTICDSVVRQQQGPPSPLALCGEPAGGAPAKPSEAAPAQPSAQRMTPPHPLLGQQEVITTLRVSSTTQIEVYFNDTSRPT